MNNNNNNTSSQRSRNNEISRRGGRFLSRNNTNTIRNSGITRGGQNNQRFNRVIVRNRRSENKNKNNNYGHGSTEKFQSHSQSIRNLGFHRRNNNLMNRLTSSQSRGTIHTRRTATAPYQSRRTIVYEDPDDMVDDMEGVDPFLTKPEKNERNNAKGSIFSRLGAPKGSEFCIEVKNLNYDVLEADVHDLFSTVGKVVNAEIIYDRTNRSTGIAKVYFADLKSAENAIKDFDGRTLDGKPMSVTMDTSNVSNNKSTMFGSAIRESRNDRMPFRVSESRRGGRDTAVERDRERGTGRIGRRNRSNVRNNDKAEENFMEDE